MEFSYRLTGTGWSECRIAAGESWLALTASYLSDALGDLLAAVLELLAGAEAAACTWEEEPGEYRWSFARHGEYVQLVIRDFVHRDGLATFDVLLPLGELAAAIASGSQRVLDEHGEAGYRDQWIEHPFPTDALVAIQAQLD